MGRLIGIDYGESRVGIAISDPMQTVATPIRTIKVIKRKVLLAEIEALCKEMDAAAVVVGMPLHLDGGKGELAKATIVFMEQLQKRLEIDVLSWDERLSSKQAEMAMRDGGASASRRKEMIDQLAAQLVLQSFMDAQDSGDESEFGFDYEYE